MVAEPHNPDLAPPPDPAAIPRLQPLPPEDARRLNAFLFSHNQDHTAAAAAFHTSEVELMLFLDQPHITPYLQRFAANRRDQRTDRAAAKLDELISRTTNDIELRRAITTLFRFYQPPRATRPRSIRTAPEDPPPDPAPNPDRPGPAPRTTDQTNTSRAIRVGSEATRSQPAHPADPDGLGPASRTGDQSQTSRAIRIGSEDPRPHQTPDADPDGSGAPIASAPGATSSDNASPDEASTNRATLQTSASPTRDHATTRPRDHSSNLPIKNLTRLIPEDPAQRTLWYKRLVANRCRWTRADQQQFEADVKAALAQAHIDARNDGIDLEADPEGAYLYTDSYIRRLRADKPP